MVVDLNRCVGCQSCTAACKHANETSPGVQWRRVLDVELGRFPDVERLFLVVGCQHCAEPPCVPVCPTGATRQRSDGLVTMNYDDCIGCAYCAVACPYQARTIVHHSDGYFGAVLTAQERATAHPERRGVAQKCTFCQDRLDAGVAAGLVPGVDPAATPACSASCIAQAIHFGDFNDPGSNVSRLLREQPSMQMHAGLGTDPQIRYLYATPAVPGRQAEPDEGEHDDPADPMTGPLQRFWDWRAAMNWCLGGTGSGLAIATWAAVSAGLINAAAAPWLILTAAGILAWGLFFVFLKIGRRGRFWRALMRPGTSWMSRELYAVIAFFGAVTWVQFAPGTAALLAAAAAAGAFLLSQSQILYRARGIPAWRHPLIPWMIVVSGLLEGAGALAVLVALAQAFGTDILQGPLPAWELAMLSGVTLLDLGGALLWRRYREAVSQGGAGSPSRRVLEAVTPALLLGYGAVFAAFVVALLLPRPYGEWAALCGGLAAVACGALWKFTVIVKAGYQQGFALPAFPQRGSGRKAAPVRLAPHAAR